MMPAYMPPYYHRNTSLCRAIVYNIKDKQNISQIRRLVLEGNYLASRLVDAKFYLLSNCYLDYYSIQNGTSDTDVTHICNRYDQI
jgi:HEPN domain-containing protein